MQSNPSQHTDLPILKEHTQKEWQKWSSDKDNKLQAIITLVSMKQNFTNLTRNEKTPILGLVTES